MKKSTVKKLVKHLNETSESTYPRLEAFLPCVLTTEEVATLLSDDTGEASNVELYWVEINTILKEISSWEVFQPFPNGKWVFWDNNAVTSELWNLVLDDDEYAPIKNAVEASDKNRVRQTPTDYRHVGNYEHLWLINYIHKNNTNNRVSAENTLLLHYTLSAFVLRNGVVPLSYKQLTYMTGLSLRSIGFAVKLLEQAGLWVVIYESKSNRGGTKFISLADIAGHALARSMRTAS